MISLKNRFDSIVGQIRNQIHLDALRQRFDRKGQGKPCGKGWISANKKCSETGRKQLVADLKSGDAGAKARVRRGKDLAQQRQELKRQVQADKGKKARDIQPRAIDPEVEKLLKEVDDIAADFNQKMTKAKGMAAELTAGAVSLQKQTSEFGSEVSPQNTVSPFKRGLHKRPKNTIAPTSLTPTKKMLDQLKVLEDLGKEAERQVRKIKGTYTPSDKNPKDLKGMMEQISDVLADPKGNETLYKLEKEKRRKARGLVDKYEARMNAIQTRLFELLNSDKLIRAPKGTKQKEYSDILKKLNDGDEGAIAKYTVPRPAGYKTSRQRKEEKANKQSKKRKGKGKK